jgi:hypothetical protein
MMRLAPLTRQVSLGDIHGSEIPFAWVQVRNPVEIDEYAPTVLIAGSAVELEDRAMPVAADTVLSEHCAAIAGILVKHRMNLVSDACPGIPDLVERAYIRHAGRGAAIDLSVLRTPDDVDTTRAYSPTGFPANGDVLVCCGSGFEVLSIVNTHCADIVLVGGGGLGSLMEGIIAVVNDLPVVSFSPSGGIAMEMQTLFERYRSRYKDLRITTCDTVEALDAFLAGFAADFRKGRRPSRLGKFLSRFLPSTQTGDLHADIAIEQDLREITYGYGRSTVRMADPVLVVDDVRILNEGSSGIAIRGYLDHAPRRYRYDDVTILVPRGLPSVVWCPSIDTFVSISAMRPHLESRCRKALDVGTGSGIIALWVAASGRADHVDGIDKNAEATRCASANASGSGLTKKCRIITGFYEDFWRESEAYGLITCNPPSVPFPDGLIREDGCFEGLGLVKELLSSLHHILTRDGMCFLTLSSVSWADAEVRRSLEDLIERGQAVLIHRRSLPFKVADVLVDPEWLRYLIEGGGLSVHDHDPYRYWHDVQVWKIGRLPEAGDETSPGSFLDKERSG